MCLDSSLLCVCVSAYLRKYVYSTAYYEALRQTVRSLLSWSRLFFFGSYHLLLALPSCAHTYTHCFCLCLCLCFSLYLCLCLCLSTSLFLSHTHTQVNLSERIYAMDVKDNAMVVACADKNIYVFDLNKV
jgi:hypothetical protein